MAHEIGPRELAERMKNGKPVLLVDVREDWEREIVHIAGDVHIAMDTVPERIAEFKAPEGGNIVTYCHGGVRSIRVAAFLERNGIPDVLSLAGGIDAWAEEVDPRIPRY